ncbi:TPA: SAM-dependent DNA methyltransferase [Listeria monocytogenes]|nr:SAM-dependent DNA methyltransferase [Listeria monocytogenes]
MNSVSQIIKLLGYEHSDLLFYQKDIIAGDKIKQYISSQMYRVIKELNPNAIFCADNKPFIAFFETDGNTDKKLLFKKIWNTQIPVVFLIYEEKIEIFNGCSLNTKTNELLFVDDLTYEKLNENSEFSFWNITHSNFWNKYKSKFSAPKIDSIMLENIKCITQLLKKSSCADFAITIVLRLIFIRFLIDRGVDLDYQNFGGSINESQEAFLKTLESKEELYKLFKHLKNKFNGNLFEIYYNKSNKSEKELLEEQSLQQLYDLMSGELEVKTGQLSLFPLYDFNIIPIELISNIYERFLGNKKQKEDSAFYTPPYLVDYILNQTIKPYLTQHQSCTVLDPACGSGIFLVETLRSIIEANNIYQPYMNDNQKLISLIKNNIFGIDKNPEAINVAIFSIYVTLLDYKDPKTLKDFKLPLLRDSNFFVSDFFDDKVKECLVSTKFDFIIGNPPWGRMDTGLHIDYCKQHNYQQQNNEIARSFIYRTKDFCHERTKCCLIVTSKIFYNMQLPAVNFRKWLLANSKIMKFIELSAVRELIFQKARGPASVIFYSFSNDTEGNLQNDINHIVLMPNLFFKLFNIIVVEKNNYKHITQKLLYNDDWAWKTVAFGSIKDYLLVKQLKDNYKSLKEYIKENSFIYGTGIQTSDGTKDTSHLLDKKLIDSKKV